MILYFELIKNKHFHSSLNCDPDELFPYEALEQQLKKFGLFAVPMAAMLLPMIKTTQDENIGMDEIAESDEIKLGSNPLENIECMERMRGVIEDLVRFGYI